MNFRQLLTSAASSKDTVLTLGVFDGVHRGHFAAPGGDVGQGVLGGLDHPAVHRIDKVDEKYVRN